MLAKTRQAGAPFSSMVWRAQAPSGEEAQQRFNDAAFIPVHPLHNGMAAGALVFEAMPWALLTTPDDVVGRHLGVPGVATA